MAAHTTVGLDTIPTVERTRDFISLHVPGVSIHLPQRGYRAAQLARDLAMALLAVAVELEEHLAAPVTPEEPVR